MLRASMGISCSALTVAEMASGSPVSEDCSCSGKETATSRQADANALMRGAAAAWRPSGTTYALWRRKDRQA